MHLLGDSDPLALPAFVIAIVGAVTALGALVWNILAWALSGPRVRVVCHVSPALDEDGIDVAAYIWNKGRAAIDIVNAELHCDGWESFNAVPLLGRDEPGLPHRLEPGSAVVMSTVLLPPGRYYGAAWYEVEVTLANGDIQLSGRAPWRPHDD